MGLVDGRTQSLLIEAANGTVDLFPDVRVVQRARALRSSPGLPLAIRSLETKVFQQLLRRLRYFFLGGSHLPHVVEEFLLCRFGLFRNLLSVAVHFVDIARAFMFLLFDRVCWKVKVVDLLAWALSLILITQQLLFNEEVLVSMRVLRLNDEVTGFVDLAILLILVKIVFLRSSSLDLKLSSAQGDFLEEVFGYLGR